MGEIRSVHVAFNNNKKTGKKRNAKGKSKGFLKKLDRGFSQEVVSADAHNEETGHDICGGKHVEDGEECKRLRYDGQQIG